MRVTFLCCYNKPEELESMLLQSYARLDKNLCNIILINPAEKRFRSAAEAYNKTIEQQKKELGEILVFCHQDVAFDNSSFLDSIISELSEEPEQILGFAGMADNGHVVSNLKYQGNKSFITRNRLKEKTKAISLDECCFAMTQSTYFKLRFDEKVCNHWHLYAVEMCYNARRNGFQSYILPDTIYHKKDGSEGMHTDKHFLASMWRLTKKYSKDFDYIYAPCYICRTNRICAAIKILRSTLRNLLHP